MMTMERIRRRATRLADKRGDAFRGPGVIVSAHARLLALHRHRLLRRGGAAIEPQGPARLCGGSRAAAVRAHAVAEPAPVLDAARPCGVAGPAAPPRPPRPRPPSALPLLFTWPF